MNGKLLNVEKLTVYDEAKIKRLFVEELEHPSYSSAGECRVTETADTNCTSLVHKPGKTGNEPSKIKGLKQGHGIKINPYDKIVEIRSNLTNMPGLNHKLLDIASQTFKQLQSGDGITLVDTADSVVISAVMKAQSCDSNPAKIQLVNEAGKIKTIAVEGGIALNDTDGGLTLQGMELAGGKGIKVEKRNNIATISCLKELKEYAPASEGEVSLLDKDAYILRRLKFSPSDFTVVHEDKTISISCKQQIKSPVTHPHAISMLDGFNIKCLAAGIGCRLREKTNGVFIDVLRPDFSEEFMTKIRSNTLSFTSSKGTVQIEVPKDELQNLGTGVHILQGKGVKCLKSGSGCKLINTEDTVEIHCENPPLTNTILSIGSLIKHGKVKTVEAGENVKVTSSKESVYISCPMKFATVGWPFAIPTENGVEYLGLRGVGGCTIKRFDKVLEISTERLKQANSPSGTFGMLTTSGEIKALCGGPGLELKDHGSYVELVPKSTIGQWDVLGAPLFDIRNQKIRTLRCPDKSIKIMNDFNSVVIQGTYSIETCKNIETPSVSLLATRSNEKNTDFLKTISVADDLEIEDRGTHVHISAKKLTSRIESLQNSVEELQQTVAKLLQIEEVVNKLKL